LSFALVVHSFAVLQAWFSGILVTRASFLNLLTALVISGCGRSTWYRAGTTEVQYRQDRHECRRLAREAHAWATAKEALTTNCLKARGYTFESRDDAAKDRDDERERLAKRGQRVTAAIEEERASMEQLRVMADAGVGFGRCSAAQLAEMRGHAMSESAVSAACLDD
jgi:hypothetical protein